MLNSTAERSVSVLLRPRGMVDREARVSGVVVRVVPVVDADAAKRRVDMYRRHSGGLVCMRRPESLRHDTGYQSASGMTRAATR
jgi:hypothetical protein